jgi:hypothetical protein
LGKGMDLISDTSEPASIGLQHSSPPVRWPFPHSDLGKGRGRAPLASEALHLLKHGFQQLLGDVAPVPYTSHHDPFLGLRPTRPLLGHRYRTNPALC